MIGKNIKRLRVELELSQKELAKRLSTQVVQLSRYENGRVVPTEATIKKIADALGVKPSDLTGERAITQKGLPQVTSNFLKKKFEELNEQLDPKERDLVLQILQLLKFRKDIGKNFK